MTMERVYIAGCGGMLGDAVYLKAAERYDVSASDRNARTPWLRAVDVGRYDELAEDVMAFQPDLLINLAAETDLEFCERNPDLAWATNALGAENCALLSQRLGIPHVYISTAGIFGGERDFYNDYDEPNPLTVYARSKLYGEQFVARHVERHFILRAGWMMGGGPALDKKFVKKIADQLRNGASEIFAVSDKLGTPTYTHDFATNLFRVVDSGLYGTYNQVCGGSGSRFDVAYALVNALGLDASVTVHGVDSGHFADEYFATRPASEQLVNFKLQQRGLNGMRDWRVALAEYAPQFREYIGR